MLFFTIAASLFSFVAFSFLTESVVWAICAALAALGIGLLLRNRLSSRWARTSSAQKLGIVLTAMILALCIPNTFLTDKLNDSFSIDLTILPDHNPESMGREAWIQAITVDNGLMNLSEIDLTENWHLNETGSAIWGTAPEGESSSVLTIGPFSGHSSVNFTLGTHQWSGIIEITTPTQVDVVDLYAEKSSATTRYFQMPETAIRWEDMRFLDFVYMIGVRLAACIWIIFLLVCLCPFDNVVLGISYFAYSVVLWLSTDYIKPAGSALFFIGILSLVSLYILLKAKDAPAMQGYRSRKMTALIALVCLYASFASFGYRLFLLGDYMSFSRDRCLCLLAGAVWFYPVVFALLVILERFKVRLDASPAACAPGERRRVWAISSLVALLCFMPSFIGFYPGGFPVDAVIQLRQASTNAYNTWHPVVHTLIIKLCMTIYHNPAFVVFVQFAVFALLIGRVAVIAYESGVKPRAVYLGAALFALLPNQAVANISPLKDFYFSYSLVWGTILLFELALNKEAIRRPSLWIRFVLCMFFMKELRHNGFAPLAFTIICLLILTFRYWKVVKLYAVSCVAAALVLIVIVEGPVFSLLNVEDNTVKPYVTMFCGVGSCLNKGKSFSEKTMTRLEDVMGMDNWVNYYGKYVGHDFYMWGGGENRMDLSSFSAKEAFAIYFEALSKYPDIIIKDRLDGMDIMWDVSQPDDPECFNARIFDSIQVDPAVGLSFEGAEEPGTYYAVNTLIAKLYRRLTNFAFNGENTQDQVSDMLLWRSGAYLIFLLVLILYWIKNRLSAMWMPSMPLLGNVAAMVLALYHQSFRYIYFIQLIVITLLIMTFKLQRESKQKNEVQKG